MFVHCSQTAGQAPTLPLAGMQKPNLLNFGTVMDSQEAEEHWHQPDRLRHPDSASFEATQLDSPDCGDASAAGLGQEVGSSDEVCAAPEKASEAAAAAPGLGVEALHDIDGASLSEDDMESVERGSSVEGESETFQAQKEWLMKMDDVEIDRRIAELKKHPRFDRFIREQCEPNKDTIEDQVSLLAFWEICRPYYESSHGRPVAGVRLPLKEEAGKAAEGEPFVPLRHADQSQLRMAKKEENKSKLKNPKGVAAAGAKRKTAKNVAAAAKSSARKKAAKQTEAVETVAAEESLPAPPIALAAAAPSGEPPTAGPAPEVSSVEAEPSECNAPGRKRKRPQLIEKDQQESYRKNLVTANMHVSHFGLQTHIYIYMYIYIYVCVYMCIHVSSFDT